MGWYRHLARPWLFRKDAEAAHEFALDALAHAPAFVHPLTSALCRVDEPALHQRLWGIDFANPVGLAAGLDKNGRAIDALASVGFSHVEIGTVTGLAQPGNPKPRLFRLVADEAVINRMGFNNEGAAAVAARLARRYADAGSGGRRPRCVLGINLGKSKVIDLDAALDDYRASVRQLARYADYVVVNVSSPNTPGLRDLQGEALLRPLLTGVRAALDAAARRPLLVKIAPDLADAGIDAAVDVSLESGCDGLIATNTTISRDGLVTPADTVAACGAGGLSGAPLRTRSTQVLARVARRLHRSGAAARVPVIGVGGIDSAATAWEKIVHGASLVQVYSALIYHGPALVRTINRGLAQRLRREGLARIADAVGRDL